MPIYEFYCPTCHTIYSFFSARIDTAAQPACPRCKRDPLERKPSRFATLKHQGEEDAADPFEALDDSKLEGAMDALMHEMSGLENEEDPRAMGQLMRRFGELTGLELGDRMEDMVRRLEAGEDPDALEAEMEGELGDDGDESMEDFFKLKKAVQQRRRRPRVDDELYFL